MSIQEKKPEDAKSRALQKLDEVYTNLADQDVGDDLLSLLNLAIEDVKSIKTSN